MFRNDPGAPCEVDGRACAIQNVSIVTVAPPKPPAQNEPDALIPEARARQWKRRVVASGLVALAAAAALSLYAIASGGSGAKLGRTGGSQAVGFFPRCRSDQLRLTGPLFNGAFTGHSIENFTFTNVSSRSCVLRGWPTVAAVVHGSVVSETTGHWRIRNGARRTGRLLPVHTVQLPPGGSASFDVVAAAPFTTNPPPCVRASGELVTPPGGHVPLRVVAHGKDEFCGAGLMVTPVAPGRIDRYQAG
jgi:hypothetical protein